MSSKQLSQLIRKAPPATVPDDEPEAPSPPRSRSTERSAAKKTAEPEVPIQVKIPESIRKQLYHLSVEEGEPPDAHAASDPEPWHRGAAG